MSNSNAFIYLVSYIFSHSNTGVTELAEAASFRRLIIAAFLYVLIVFIPKYSFLTSTAFHKSDMKFAVS